MTGTELQTLNTNLQSGYDLGAELFLQLANMKKGILENSRDWVILRNFDSSITFATTDDYTSTKSLPARFLRIYAPFSNVNKTQTGVYLVDSSGNRRDLNPIPFAERFDYKTTEGYFYIDYASGKIGRTGTTAGTLHLFYLKGTADITATSTWEFPTYAHPLLAYEVAMDHFGIIDWDTVNSNKVPFTGSTIRQIMSSLYMWNARLEQAELGV